ncbi:RNA polymerase subunit sigma-70 [Ahniella affigens]|uniref:RNA polymerase subunit sigma-70 n=1 Tax=Ahniella affigens TaxID=2021234 RepID=A0A2P1PY29_9GAMM|nr:ECF-type sigma factor [Ahniella affigens]AVP99745.1 RNA polymerase subunit sigma-70 [Ahniella affigens]
MTDTSITQLLSRWRTGDRDAETALIEAVYPILRQIAHAQIRRNSGFATLQATELANEAFEKIRGLQALELRDRDHFFAMAATVIRRVLIDYIRERGAEKRGGGLKFVDMSELLDEHATTLDDTVDWLAVDQGLVDLERRDPEVARVVELKLFSGLSADQIATVCNSSVATVGRQWRFARTWLARRLGGSRA